MSINYSYYKSFYYVSKYKNLTEAAKFLYSSQPNVSREIALLEREYGCRLFERSNRGMKLTPEGEVLYSYVKPAIEQLNMAEDSLTRMTSLQHGVVNIGISDTALSNIIIPALNKFRENYPSVLVRIVSSYCLESVNAVKNESCDFAVAATPFPEDEKLKCTKILEVSDIAIGGTAYTELTKRTQSLAELNEYPMICVGGKTIYYPFFTDLFAKKGLRFEPELFSANTAQTLLMVRNKLGIGFVPRSCAEDDIERGLLFEIPLSESIPHRFVCMIENRNHTLSLAASELKKIILEI